MDITVGLEATSYWVDENIGEVEVCVTLQNFSSGCAIGFDFSVLLVTNDDSAGIYNIFMNDFILFHQI